MQKKYFIVPILLVVSVALTYTYATVYNVPSTTVTSSGGSGAIKYESLVCKEVYRANGETEYLGCNHNYLSQQGTEVVRDLLTHADTAAINNIAVGGNTSEWQNKSFSNETTNTLENEYGKDGLDRVACTLANATETKAKVANTSCTHTFTSTANMQSVNLTGLFNTSTSASCCMFVADSFTNAELQTNDQLNVTWYFWIAHDDD